MNNCDWLSEISAKISDKLLQHLLLLFIFLAYLLFIIEFIITLSRFCFCPPLPSSLLSPLAANDIIKVQNTREDMNEIKE